MAEKKKGPGRMPKVPYEDQFKEYKKEKSSLLTPSNEIKPYTDEIFTTIGKTLGMTPKAVHFAVTRNINEVFGDEATKIVIPKANETMELKNTKDEEEIDYLFHGSDGNISVIVNIHDPKELFFFNLIEQVGPSRLRTTLRPGWTDTLFDIIVRETKTPCVYNFRRVDFTAGEFKVSGSCKECESTVLVNSSNNRRTLKIEMSKGSKPHTHTKFRRLTSTRSDFIASQLSNKSVNKVYLDQANEISIDGEIPRDLVSKKSIENIRTKMNAQTDNAIDTLRIMKYSNKYGESIKEIQSDPFSVIYWTKVQQYVYNQIKKKHGAAISLDATGGLINTKSVLNGIDDKLDIKMGLPHVFLYMINVKCPNGKSTPVGQMLSSQQDATRISYFLDRWKIDFSIPSEIAIDDSKALQKSCAKSFNGCRDINEYIRKCFEVLNGDRNKLPKTFIRLDVAHYIKNLHRQKELKKMDGSVRQLYLAVFGYLMQCKNFEEISKIVEHLVILANAFEEKEDSQQMLSNLVRTHDIRVMHNESEESDDEEQTNAETAEDETTQNTEDVVEFRWFDDILNRVLAKLDETPESKSIKNSNAHYNPKLNEFFRHEFKRLPLWTSVMTPYYQSPYTLGISNDTESRFNMLKNHVFDDVNLPIRPDIFIRRMLDVVDNIATMNRLEMQLKTNLLHAKKAEIPMKMTAPSQSTDDLNVTLKDLSLEVSEFLPSC